MVRTNKAYVHIEQAVKSLVPSLQWVDSSDRTPVGGNSKGDSGGGCLWDPVTGQPSVSGNSPAGAVTHDVDQLVMGSVEPIQEGWRSDYR